MWLLRSYAEWLEFVRTLVVGPSHGFPRQQVQLRLAETLDTVVSWNWEDPDGTEGFELSHPIEDWPTAEYLEIWESGARDLHPLLHWSRVTQDPRPMSMARVPNSMVPP